MSAQSDLSELPPLMSRGIVAPLDLSRVPLSLTYESNGIVYISGMVPIDEEGFIVQGDVGVQTTATLTHIENSLARIGLSRTDIVKCLVMLVDEKRDFDAMNVAYAAFFGEHRPARSTLGVELALDVLIEIEAVAHRPS